MSDKKPGFLEGFLAGTEDKKAEPDSQSLASVKEYIEDISLSPEDRAQLAGWLVGDVIKSSFISAFLDE